MAWIPPLRLQLIEDRVTNDVARKLAEAIQTMPQLVAFLDGQPLFGAGGAGTAFTAGQTITFGHQLGRAPKGLFCVDAVAADWSGRRVPFNTSQDLTDIAIRSTNAGTFKFWIW
jgi:hypothetical protein